MLSSTIKKIKNTFFKNDLIIDIGSNHISFSELNYGENFKEESLIAIEYHDTHKSIVAIGNEAKNLIGRTSEDIRVIRPIGQGRFSAITLSLILP